jgi:hypothetical protein
MSWDDDIFDMTDTLMKKGNKAENKLWDKICRKINEMEANEEASLNVIRVCEANVRSNNQLFDHLIENDIVSRDDLIKYKMAASMPSWWKGYINNGETS